MSEFRRAGIRIATNYIRLLATICLGLALIPLLLRTVGSNGVALISLIGATAGFAVMLEEIVGWSMIRELGAAHHHRDPNVFLRMYNSAVAVCGVTAVLTLGVFGLVILIVPLLKIDPGLISAARWFVLAKGLESSVVVLLAPQFNMYVATERMVAYNSWLIAKRATQISAAIALFWIAAGPVSNLIWFGFVSAGLHMAVMFCATALILRADRRLRPSISHASREGVRAILGISGWNVAILGSQMLGVPAGALLMNLAFGLFGNLIFGFAQQLAGYARMAVSGMTAGVDAVAARLSSSADVDHARLMLRRLVHHSTRLHGLVACPAAVGIGLLAQPFLHVWVGSRYAPGAPEIPAAAMLTKIMVIGFAIMGLADNWMRILYGAGQIRRYAPLVVVGGFANLAFAGLFLLVLPQDDRYTSVALAFSIMYVIFHLLLVPAVVARTFQMRYLDVFQPLLRPAVGSLIAVPVLLAFGRGVNTWNLWWLGAAAGGYGLVYAIYTWLFVLEPPERRRVTQMIGLGGVPAGNPAQSPDI